MKWHIKHHLNETEPKTRVQEIIQAIFSNRGIFSPDEISLFLNPPTPLGLSATQTGIDPAQLQTAISIIKNCIKEKVPIIVYGDYDADGITATGILWEALHSLKATVTPFIPSRELHGYGLSVTGLKDALKNTSTPLLVITVDNGIVAHEAVDWLKNQHIKVIITDHHQPMETLPAADAIVHSSIISGAGVSWMLAKELAPESAASSLDIACIGTVADMMPLTGINRQIVKFGLESIRESTRPGINALLSEGLIAEDKILTPTDINYTIAPRLNAMGRLEHAIDSLRLLCTTNTSRAKELATLLGDTNRNRQDMTQTLLDQAKTEVGNSVADKIIIIDHEDYHEGIIGLIAGKLVETYYRPAIVISRKDGVSKASARSIKGVNITELIRSQSHLLLGVGGHPMAAGFSISTDKIDEFRRQTIEYSNTHIDNDLLDPTISLDCEIKLSDITDQLYQEIQQLQPFGIGNPQPVFSTKNVTLKQSKLVGNAGQHLKLLIQTDSGSIDALWFGHGAEYLNLADTKHLDLAFTISQNTWNHHTKLQLLIKDIVIS